MHPVLLRILKILGIAVLISVVLTTIILGIVIWKINEQIVLFETHSGRSVEQIVTEIERGTLRDPILQDGRKNILLLGGDEIVGRDSSQGVLTDTILIASISLDEGDVVLLSIPRDLWIPSYRTKINALHYYGEQEAQRALEAIPDLEDDELDAIRTSLLHEVLDQLTGLEMHHTVFLSLDDVADVVDLVEGVEVYVERSFVDERFPRSGVDVSTETDPLVLYETIQFEQGMQEMNSEQVLQFLRSRNSVDEIEGSDLGRIARQQAVFEALARKVLHPNTLFSAVRLGKLFAFYADRYESSISIEEIFSVLSYFAHIEPSPEIMVRSIEIPIEAGKAEGLLYTPPISKYGLWVYEAWDPTFQSIADFVQEQL